MTINEVTCRHGGHWFVLRYTDAYELQARDAVMRWVFDRRVVFDTHDAEQVLDDMDELELSHDR